MTVVESMCLIEQLLEWLQDKIDNFLYLITLLNIFIYFQIVSIACMMLFAAGVRVRV